MAVKVSMGQRSIEILLVEDNLGDITLMKEILKMSRFPIHLNVVRNGSEALDYLYHEGEFHNSILPDLILLDLNLPKVDGREVLAQIKRDSLLGQIPTLVMTSSKNEADVLEAYKNNANFYIVKPMDLDHYMVIMKYLEDFWIEKIK
jgi:two-component system, chemotaxis family, response regulator Rcp1